MRTIDDTGRGRGRRTATTLAVALAAAAALAAASLAPAPLAALAQDRGADCHCVDGNGDPIADCVCLTTPSVDAFTLATPFMRRSVVGVTIDPSQGADVDALGAEIQDVQADGPADRAGLRAGDIVVRIAGRSVFDPLEPSQERTLSETGSVPVQRFVRLVGALDPDEPVQVEYIRGGRTTTATLTPEAAARFPGLTVFGETRGGLPGVAWRFDSDEIRGRLEGEGSIGGGSGVFRFEGPGRNGDALGLGGRSFPGFFRSDPCMNVSTGDDRTQVFVLGGSNCVDGVEFVELNPGLGEYFGTDDGVLVANVAEASTLGLRAGDVLQAVDGREVRSPEHALRILRSYDPDEEIRLRVVRKGAETEVLARRR